MGSTDNGAAYGEAPSERDDEPTFKQVMNDGLKKKASVSAPMQQSFNFLTHRIDVLEVSINRLRDRLGPVLNDTALDHPGTPEGEDVAPKGELARGIEGAGDRLVLLDDLIQGIEYRLDI